ncbi:hypothetical protein [Paenibacillus sp. 276b]|uniref:hypothetical protein n=1 Tax=Paenibacillus sp. 276b TaxID=1566277 RepID=UPI00089707A1|nr:hypothetical protein [Paenibacillus sp. 276b]SEB10690.1 hypothetical protein SAMN03159332_3556 [Paenibacillus sp. 276b]
MKFYHFIISKWYRIVIFLLIIFCVVPFVTNILMIIPNHLMTVDTSNVWIGFFGSYFGGLISGLFTLVGVLMAIKREQINKTLDDFGIKARMLDELIHEIDMKFAIGIDKLNDPANDVEFVNLETEFDAIIFNELRETKKFSSEINADAYYVMLDFQKKLTCIYQELYEKVLNYVMDSVNNNKLIGEEEFRSYFNRELVVFHSSDFYDLHNEIIIELNDIRKKLENDFRKNYEKNKLK